MKSYFAGPLFTPYERDYISACARVLRENGIDPFVPHEAPKFDEQNDPRPMSKQCFDGDFEGIFNAKAMLAIINGTEVDDGTACEIGIFYSLMKQDASRKGIVALHDDYRTGSFGEGKGLNAFVLGCLNESGVIVKTLEEAVAQLVSWKKELLDEELLPERGAE
jgi:hypothetical protein